MSVKVGDRVWINTWANWPPGEPGTVLELRTSSWGYEYAVIAPDSRRDRPVYLCEGAVYGFDPIAPGACPDCNGSPGRVHRFGCPRYPRRRAEDARIVGREVDGPPSYCAAPFAPAPSGEARPDGPEE
jgi:hypothetical protein